MTTSTKTPKRTTYRTYRSSINLAIGSKIEIGCKSLAFAFIVFVATTSVYAAESGEAIYKQQCAKCHGLLGEGVEGKYEAALTGDLSETELIEVISQTMPEGAPERCDGEDAKRVAQYIRERFYSQPSTERVNSPQRTLSRLTGEQLRQSIADLYGHFQSNPWMQNERGVAATYFEGSRWAKDKIKLERTDPVINFDFGKENPIEGVPKEEFYIHWEGSLKVDHSGRYEIILRSSLSCTLKFGANERTLVNNHVQSEGKEEFRQTMFLTAGRAYPFTLEFIQRKRKTEQPPAKVSLSWIPPGGVEEILPTRQLIPNRLPASFSIQTKLPPDDRSYGYERGTSVDRQWDDSTTRAALEFAEVAKTELFPKYRRAHQDIPSENRESLRSFLEETLQTAFRGPLDEETRSLYIDQQLAVAEDDGEAIKRSILMSLKSPRFLYPTIDRDRTTSQRVANRLALVLYDSLPADPWLTTRIANNKILDSKDAHQVASKMIRDYRAQAKIRSFLYQWLDLEDISDISKDQQLYPGFDQGLVQELRGSFDAMIEDNLVRGGNLKELLLSDWVMTSPKLQDFYGRGWEPEKSDEPSTPINHSEAAENEDPRAAPANDPQDAKQQASEADLIPEPNANETTDESVADPLSSPQPDLPSDHPKADAFVRSTADPEIHAGIISHPLLMSNLAYFKNSSPIHRGVFLTRRTLGRVLRPPSEAFTPINPDLHPNLTTRQRVQLQTNEANCQVCHRKINSLGFALEAFDAVGRFREKERNLAIDASGQYQPVEGSKIEFSGARELAQYLARSPDCHAAFVESAFEFFVKQPINAFGADRKIELITFFHQNDYRIEDLIVEIACIAADPKLSAVASQKPQ